MNEKKQWIGLICISFCPFRANLPFPKWNELPNYFFNWQFFSFPPSLQQGAKEKQRTSGFCLPSTSNSAHYREGMYTCLPTTSLSLRLWRPSQDLPRSHTCMAPGGFAEKFEGRRSRKGSSAKVQNFTLWMLRDQLCLPNPSSCPAIAPSCGVWHKTTLHGLKVLKGALISLQDEININNFLKEKKIIRGTNDYI